MTRIVTSIEIPSAPGFAVKHRVYAAMMFLADRHGRVIASRNDLAGMVGAAASSVSDSLIALEDIGLIRKVSGGQDAGRPNIYSILPAGATKPVRPPEPAVKPDTPRRAEPGTPPKLSGPEAIAEIAREPESVIVPPAAAANPGEFFPQWCPANDVGRILMAARVSAPTDRLRWFSSRHHHDADALVQAAGGLSALLQVLRAAPAAGDIPRLTHLLGKVTGRG